MTVYQSRERGEQPRHTLQGEGWVATPLLSASVCQHKGEEIPHGL